MPQPIGHHVLSKWHLAASMLKEVWQMVRGVWVDGDSDRFNVEDDKFISEFNSDFCLTVNSVPCYVADAHGWMAANSACAQLFGDHLVAYAASIWISPSGHPELCPMLLSLSVTTMICRTSGHRESQFSTRQFQLSSGVLSARQLGHGCNQERMAFLMHWNAEHAGGLDKVHDMRMVPTRDLDLF